MGRARDISKVFSTSTSLATDSEISGSYIANSIIDAKGDLIVGSAADTASRLAVGTNNYILTAASGETTGLKWTLPGKVLQVVSNSSTSSVSWSDTNVDRLFFEVTITPKSSTSTMYVIGQVTGIDNAGAGRVYILLKYSTSSGGTTGTNMGSGGTLGETAQNSSGTTGISHLPIHDSVALGNTTTTYFKIIYGKGDNSGTNYLNRYNGKSMVTVFEVEA